MKFQPFAFLSVALAMGILIAYYFNIASEPILWLGGIVFVLILIQKFTGKFKQSFTFLGLILVCLIGIFRYNQVNQIEISDSFKDAQLLDLQIVDVYKPSEKYHKYKAKIIRSQDSILIGENLLFYLSKSQNLLHQEDKVLTQGKVTLIPKPKNPHQFDYQRLMRLKGVYFQVFSDSIYQIKYPQQFSIYHKYSVFKQKIKHHLKTNSYSEASQIFVSALALGDRTDFDSEIQNTLSTAGVMHLFAISGLHIGIIFWLIRLLFYPLLFLPYGREIRIITALILIWIFASFVNFTPSVTRAAFMISFYHITFLLRRPTNIFHTIFFTAFVLLIINPNQLFDVGFQLSYSAVFFIAWLYTPFRNLLPKYRKPYKNYPFDILSVTLVAQLGVMPISIYYFNQFSALFIIGNLLLIPLAIVLVAWSMILVILIGFSGDCSFVVNATNWVFDLILSFIEKLSSFSDFVFKGISISFIQLVLLLGIVMLIKPLLVKFRWVKLLPILGLISLFQLSRFYDNYKFSQKREFIVFSQYKGNVIGIRKGGTLMVFRDVEDSIKTEKYVINPYVLKEKIDSLVYFGLNESVETDYFIKEKGLIKFNNQSFFITNNKMDSLPNVDYVIAIKGRLNSKTYIPKQIKRVIADESNYPNVIKNLKLNSDKIYSIKEKGAFILSVNPIER